MRIPKLRKHKPSGRAFVEVAALFSPARRYLGPWKSAEADEKYAQILARLAALKASKPTPRPLHPNHVAVEDVVQESLDHYKRISLAKTNPKRTEYEVVRAAVKPLLKLHRKTKVVDFGPLEFEAVREAMVAKGWSRGYVNSQANRVRRVFKRGVAKSLCPPEILTALKAVEPLRRGATVAHETAPKRPVEWRHVRRVLPFLSPHVADLVRVQWLTGARSDEICGMRTKDMNTRGDVWSYRPMDHKGAWRDHERFLAFGPLAQGILARWLTGVFVFSPTKAMASLKRVRAGMRDRYTAGSYQHAILHGLRKLGKSLGAEFPKGKQPKGAFEAILASVGVTYWHPHQMRHSRATLVRERWGLEAAEAAIGDRAEATARYAEKSRRLAIEVAREIG